MNKYSVGYNLDFREAQCVSITRVVRSAVAIIVTEQVEEALGSNSRTGPKAPGTLLFGFTLCVW